MEAVRRVGNRTLVAVHRFEREGEERLVMAYRSLGNKSLVKVSPNMVTRAEVVSEQEPVKQSPVGSIGQEVVS